MMDFKALIGQEELYKPELSLRNTALFFPPLMQKTQFSLNWIINNQEDKQIIIHHHTQKKGYSTYILVMALI